VELSKYQQAIVKAAKTEKHLAVCSRAGGGKSFMLELLAKSSKDSFLLLAFNKHNAEEMQARLPSHANSRTSHSIGKMLLRHKGAPDFNKSVRIAKALGYKSKDFLNFEHFWNYYRLLNAKSAAQVQDYCEFSVEEFADDVCKIEACAIHWYEKSGCIDFTDMLWLPTRVPCRKLQHNTVALDEMHDLSPIALEMVRQHVLSSVKTVIVYDDMQNIFESLNATLPDNGEYWSSLYNSKQLSLPISYRCPERVVEEAQQYVPDIEAHKTGGSVVNLRQLPDNIPKGSLVLSGHYEFLIPEFMQRRLKGDKCLLRGHNFFEEALDTAKKVVKEGEKGKFSDFMDLATEALQGKSDATPFNLAGIARKNHYAASIQVLRSLSEHFTTLSDAEKFAGQATKGTADYTFSSIHRCKGSEADNVFFLSYDKYQEGALQGDQTLLKLVYVGVTRAKENLFLC